MCSPLACRPRSSCSYIDQWQLKVVLLLAGQWTNRHEWVREGESWATASGPWFLANKGQCIMNRRRSNWTMVVLCRATPGWIADEWTWMGLDWREGVGSTASGRRLLANQGQAAVKRGPFDWTMVNVYIDQWGIVAWNLGIVLIDIQWRLRLRPAGIGDSPKSSRIDRRRQGLIKL